MSQHKLTRRTAVVELADGRVLTVRIINPDVLRFEETAKRQGWPGHLITDSGTEYHGNTLKLTFEAYAALKRTGQYDGDWERFRSDCIDVEAHEEEVDPTQPGVGPGSSPSSHGSGDSISSSSPEPMTP